MSINYKTATDEPKSNDTIPMSIYQNVQYDPYERRKTLSSYRSGHLVESLDFDYLEKQEWYDPMEEIPVERVSNGITELFLLVPDEEINYIKYLGVKPKDGMIPHFEEEKDLK